MTVDDFAEVEAPPAAAEPVMARVVQRLLGFWVERGHLLLAPSDVPIPAGNMHPEVFFNLLQERPWSSVVAQPVRRPRDGRGGLHPYRLARHLELHVLLRGSVERMQELYLDSLQVVGFNPEDHDVTFTDGPWESHSLGAWGNGWHVQLDGLGVARLTFLRQLAGQPLETPAAELVYGVERTALVLADVAGIETLPSGPQSASGEPWRAAEEELSRYAFEVADAGAWQDALAGREDEARRCLGAGLPRMAYELAIGNLQHIEMLLALGQLEIRDRVQHLQRVQELVTSAAELVRQGADRVAETTQDPIPSEVPSSEASSSDSSRSEDAADTEQEAASEDGSKPEVDEADPEKAKDDEVSSSGERAEDNTPTDDATSSGGKPRKARGRRRKEGKG